ncbi:MAG: hypothetical protein WC477_07025 [Patescibacteria group bacterium]
MHLAVTKRFDLPYLMGDRSVAVFDLWSLQHFCAGILLASIAIRIASLGLWREKLGMILLFEICWEALELSMESGYFGQTIAQWKGGFEHWSNRLIGDPLMVIIGALVAKKFSSAWKIIFIPATLWLLLNISYSSSMHVQHALFGQRD